MRNSQTETLRFVISLRSMLTFSVRYLCRQHMVLPPQTVTVTRQTITTSVFTTRHYSLEGEENCLAETHLILRLPRGVSQNKIMSRPISTASRHTETQMRQFSSINTLFHIFVSNLIAFPKAVICLQSPEVCDIPDYGVQNQSSSKLLHSVLSL